ncbi:MAG: PQQ-binding-like beta-propeller repeat protein [Candidatus Hydrogenedentes bacterium]|nr:PQQ-binding-like beta-propeller repeat protein [Candidatus Hydrogenedentota bacterium]
MNESSRKIKTIWFVVGTICCISVLAAVWYRHTGETTGQSAKKSSAIADKKPEPPSEWNTYHGGPNLDGVADTSIPADPSVLWRFDADAPVSTTPVSCAGNIFCVTDKGHLYGLGMDGCRIWSRELVRNVKKDGSSVAEIIDAPPACFDNTVLVGSADGTLYAFDGTTGKPKWTCDIGGPILGTPNFRVDDTGKSGSVVFVISQDDGILICIDADSGSILWQSEGVERCDGSASVGTDSVVFGSCAAALHVFSPLDGSKRFDIEIDADSQVAGGVALVGNEAFSGSRSGKVIRADTSAGKLVWVNKDCNTEVFTTPAVAADLIVVAASDGTIMALDRSSGKQKWTFQTDGEPGSPVIARDKVVVSSGGTLYLLNANDGTKIWSYNVSDEISSPAVFNGMIVVGTDEGIVAAFGEPQQ